MKITPLGDSAVIATVGDALDAAAIGAVQALAAALEAEPLPGYIECVPANLSLTVFYDAGRMARTGMRSPYERLCQWIGDRAAAAARPATGGVERRVVVPVCYGGAEGPDLEALAAAHHLSPDKVVQRHSGADYRVSAIGFAPGFPYLIGLPESLHTPRRKTPRTRVPAGSVAIGGSHTGIYPSGSPGGWHLIGRTPLRLFDPLARPPALLQVGDWVQFEAISADEFHAATQR